MKPVIDTLDPSWIYPVYDRYTNMLYTYLTDVCYSSADAGIALTHTFEAMVNNPSAWQGPQVNGIALLQLAVRTARKHSLLKDPDSKNCYSCFTLLHYLIFQKDSLHDICKGTGKDQWVLARQFHRDVRQILITSLSSAS